MHRLHHCFHSLGKMPLDCLFPQPGVLPPVHRLLGGLRLPRIRTPCKRWQPPSKLTWHTQSRQAFGTICWSRGGPLSPPPLAPVPLRPEPQYAAPPGLVPPVAPAAPYGLGPLMGGIPQPAFGPPPAYQMPPPPAAPYAGAPVPAPPVFWGPFPRTGFDYTRLQMPGAPVPPAPRQSTFFAPFVPVQPPKPLLIDDFLTVNAVHALNPLPIACFSITPLDRSPSSRI
jgi:hypothetical protein